MRMSKQIRLGGPASRWSADIPVRLSAQREQAGRAKRRRAALVLAASLCLSAIFVTSPPGLAQPAPQSPATTAASRNAALIAATADVLKETSELRELPILRPVQSSTQSRTEIERMLIKNLDEETTPAQIHATEVTLKKLGLAPADFQYRALMLRLLTEQVAGYYDPKTREFHLADWIDLDGQKPVMAHELTHALQDQHFNLRRFEHWPKGDSDAELAAHALIEGDATLAMTLYVMRNPLRALAFLKSLGASGMPSEELDHAPRALRETLLFPYQEGILWTRNLYQHGGWNEVSQAFTTLPQSTEQVMHSEKYFVHEAPVKVALPDITTLLNGRGQRAEVRSQRSEVRGRRSEVSCFPASASVSLRPERDAVKSVPPAVAGGFNHPVWSAATGRRFSSWHHAQAARATWKKLDSDVNGEWGFYLILDQFLKSPAKSRRAAAGWGGDRYSIYEGPKGEVLYISLSTWDTENDAREFFNAYVERTERRYASAIPVDPTPNPESPTLSRAFRTSQGTVLIERRGARVLVIEGASGNVDERNLIKALWQ
jgi:hypothetical protein